MAALLFLFPMFVTAAIEIRLSGKFDGENSNLGINFKGFEMDVISDVERSTFGLNDNAIKDAVNTYFGQRPTEAYLRSPTPWGDLYQTYGWSQVLRSLVPTTARILKVSSEPRTVMQRAFHNNNSEPVHTDVSFPGSLQEKISSTWIKGGDLSVRQKIKYSIDIGASNGGSMSYTSPWGENFGKTRLISTPRPSYVMIQPGQTIMAELRATRGLIRMEVEYEAFLLGDVALYYKDAFNGRHFWAVNIFSVMSAGRLTNEIASKQIIDIEFYTNVYVHVIN